MTAPTVPTGSPAAWPTGAEVPGPGGAVVQPPLQGQQQSTARPQLPARLAKDAAADPVMNPADCLVGTSY